MNFKRNMIIKVILLISLIATVGCGVLIIVSAKDRDVRSAKKFVEMLNDKEMIDVNKNIDSVEFIKSETLKKDGSSNITTLASKEYGVDLDEDYNVIGFLNKVSTKGPVNITKEVSKDIATKYLAELYSDEVLFKRFNEELGQEMQYYTVVFSKCNEGYPFYYDEIIVNIDKTTGKLVGYTNVTTQGKPRKPEITLKKEESEKLALDKYNVLYKNGAIYENTYMAYGLRKDQSDRSVLCYVVSIKGKDESGKEDVYYKYFVSTQSGQILDSYRNSDVIIKSAK